MAKKTLYQELGIPATASTSEIEAGFQRALAALDAAESGMSRDDYDFQRTLLLFARDTLSDPVSRMGYDEKLMARRAPAASPTRASGMSQAVIPASGDLASRADALAMRAEAMALRADAMAIRAGADDGLGSLGGFRTSSFPSSGGRSSPLRTLFVGMTILSILAIMLQLYSVHSSRAARAQAEKLAVAAAKAKEKLAIQDYYQKYGERPASADEARRLDRERQQREADARQAERERQRTERATLQQQEADRRYADRISFDLRRAEEAARREAAQEEKRARDEAQRQQREEEMRTERMQQRWRSVMQRP